MTTDYGQPVLETPELVALLDDHHLVVVGHGPMARSELARALAETLERGPETHVVRIPGERVRDLDGFLAALERAFDVAPPVPRTLDGALELLRRPGVRGRRQYLLWEHADVCLDCDPDLFGCLAAAFVGVAAEREALDPDPGSRRRAVFLGGDKLGALADAENGPFGRWPDATEHAAFGAFAETVGRPPVLMYRLDG